MHASVPLLHGIYGLIPLRIDRYTCCEVVSDACPGRICVLSADIATQLLHQEFWASWLSLSEEPWGEGLQRLDLIRTTRTGETDVTSDLFLRGDFLAGAW